MVAATQINTWKTTVQNLIERDPVKAIPDIIYGLKQPGLKEISMDFVGQVAEKLPESDTAGFLEQVARLSQSQASGYKAIAGALGGLEPGDDQIGFYAALSTTPAQPTI